MRANETRGPDPELSLDEIEFGLIGEGADSRQQDAENSPKKEPKKQNYQFAPKERDREMRKPNERSGDDDDQNDDSVNPN